MASPAHHSDPGDCSEETGEDRALVENRDTVVRRGSDLAGENLAGAETEGKDHGTLILEVSNEDPLDTALLCEEVNNGDVGNDEEDENMGDSGDFVAGNSIGASVSTDEQRVETSEVYSQDEEHEEECSNLVIEHMDITEPLSTLRKLLENQLQCSLEDYEFWLQDTVHLDSTKNLVSQCIQGEGIVQINVEVKPDAELRPRLNIVDVLKSADEFEELCEDTEPMEASSELPVRPGKSPAMKVVYQLPVETRNVTRWVIDSQFAKQKEQFNIPDDPADWTNLHVKYWLQWAIRKFSLIGVDPDAFNLTGQDLMELQHEDFVHYFPLDNVHIFWTHIELLRKCKVVAVMEPQATGGNSRSSLKSYGRKVRSVAMSTSTHMLQGNRSGTNSQIQLWQFLLELLIDKNCRDIIQWVGDDGEFKLVNPEHVAQLWGQRKSKPTMNYEKLSRALRYYYDGEMISKVHGKRFVYKFVCDLRTLLGYSSSELDQLVLESIEPSQLNVFSQVGDGVVSSLVLKQH